MNVKYVCTADDFVPFPSPDVIQFNTIGEFDKLIAFFGEPAEGEEPMTDEDKTEYFDMVKSGKWVDFVVEKNNEIVARAVAWNFKADSSEVACVVTRPAFRNQGLGTQLVSACTNHILQNGKVAMGITAVDNIPMRKLFEKIGFRLCE